eukprot:gene24225-biopygen9908
MTARVPIFETEDAAPLMTDTLAATLLMVSAACFVSTTVGGNLGGVISNFISSPYGENPDAVQLLRMVNVIYAHGLHFNNVHFLMNPCNKEGVRDRNRAGIEAADPTLRCYNGIDDS